jgi:hypothetical protein
LFVFLNFHSHRGFSPVPRASPYKSENRFKGLLLRHSSEESEVETVETVPKWWTPLAPV